MRIIDTGSEPQNKIAERVRGVGHSTLATLFGSGYNIAATYVFYALIARSLSVSDFGRLALGITVLQTAAITARIGLDQALLATDSSGAANRFGAQAALVISITLAVFTIIACHAAGYPLPSFGLWLAVALPCVAVGQYIFGALRATGEVVVAAFAHTVVQPTILAIGALLAFVYAPSTTNFALALTISWAVTLLFALRVNWGRGKRIDRHAAAEFLRTGRRMLGVTMLQQASSAADILILSALAGAAEVGRYAVAHKIAMVFLVLHGTITSAATPYMRSLIEERPLLTHFYHSVTRWMLSLSLPPLVVVIAAPHLLLSLFGSEYANESGAPLIILSIAAVIFLVTGPAGSTLLCTGHARQLLRVAVVGSVTYVIAVACLARFGAVGVAAGVLLGQITSRGLLVLAMRRYAKIEVADAPLLLIAFGAVVSIIAARLMIPWLGVFPAVTAGSLLALALAFIVLSRSGDVAALRAEFRRTKLFQTFS